MLNTPRILGMSMAPQKNRRSFVIATYAILVAVVAIILTLPPLGGRVRLMWLLFVPLAYNVVSYAVFGKLVRPTVLTPRGGEMTSLGLTPKRRDPDEPDERELAVRNAAHYQAFRVAAVYGFFVWVSIASFWHLNGPRVVLLVLLLVMPLLTILFTLPQAIILWTEPDVAEEIKTSNAEGRFKSVP
jgi:hypothetical protein